MADGRLGAWALTQLPHWSELLQAGEAVLSELQAEHPPSEQANSTLERLRGWLNAQAQSDPAVARLPAKLIPAQCTFERDGSCAEPAAGRCHPHGF